MGDDRVKYGIRMNYEKLYQSIATKLNRDIKAGGVDVDQIKRVASGEERTLNHPIISLIRTELRAAKVRISGEAKV